MGLKVFWACGEFPSPIKVTLFHSRRVVATQRQWPSSTGGTPF